VRILLNVLVAFFIFGAAMCALTIVLLAVPGTALDSLWRLNPDARRGFVAMDGWALVLMAIVGSACAFAAIGLARRREWGRQIAILIFVVNAIGDSVNALHDPRTLIGLPIAAAAIAVLLKVEFRRDE